MAQGLDVRCLRESESIAATEAALLDLQGGYASRLDGPGAAQPPRLVFAIVAGVSAHAARVPEGSNPSRDSSEHSDDGDDSANQNSHDRHQQAIQAKNSIHYVIHFTSLRIPP